MEGRAPSSSKAETLAEGTRGLCGYWGTAAGHAPGLGCTIEILSAKLMSSLTAFAVTSLDGLLLLPVHLSFINAPGTFTLRFIHPHPLTASTHVRGGMSCLRSLLTFRAACSSSIRVREGHLSTPSSLAQADSVAWVSAEVFRNHRIR